MATRWTFVFAALSLVVTACGGSVTSGSNHGQGGSAGTSGSGGTSGNGGTSGSGGGPSSCTAGGNCSTEGDTCTESGCCPCTYICSSKHWQPGMCPACAAPTCPAAPPNEGDPCNKCEDPVNQPCSYGVCTEIATCDGQRWHVEIPPCPPPAPCGTSNTPCPAGELCVHPGGLGDSPYCAANPCGPSESVSCQCAGSLCTYGFCTSATPGAVYCDCPSC